MNVTITFEGCIIGGDEDSIPDQLDAVMDELLRLDATDPAIGLSLGSREVEISVVIESDSLDVAAEQGNAMIRSAIHYAGGATPGWQIDWTRSRTATELSPTPC
jgi:hypothetical protein